MKTESSIQSMTGYATVQISIPTGHLIIELRSVNSRFLDIYFKLSDDYRTFEPKFRDIISQYFKRGKIECRISFQAKIDEQSEQALTLNDSIITQILNINQTLTSKHPNLPPITMGDLLRLPNVIQVSTVNIADHEHLILEGMVKACQELSDTRTREGTSLVQILLDKVAQMDLLTNKLMPLLPTIVQQQQDKLKQRLQEALQLIDISADNPMIMERITQETTIFGIRVDIAEELARLQTHLKETKRMLTQHGPVGKRLDFMMQELNREANTLGSKASIIELSDAAMQLKLLIEQMREQVQNLE